MVLPPLASDKTIVYETGMKSYPASTFVTGGSPTGNISFGIQKTAPGQYQYVTNINLHNLANSTFKSGKIMDLPYFYPIMSNFWIGSVSASNSSNGSYAYKYASFYVNNGALYAYTYEYNRNNIPLAFSSFVRNSKYNLPRNLSGFSEASTQTQVNELLSKLCYQYKYDHRNRLIEKKIPGKEWEYIIYDSLDRPVLTQDANQRKKNQWLFTKYDAFGRVAYTGVFYHSLADLNYWRKAANNSSHKFEEYISQGVVRRGTLINYTLKSFPVDFSQIYTINYYDTYKNVLPSGFTTPVSFYNQKITTNTKGLPTVSKVRVLDVSPEKWITTVTYYDEKARPIYIYSKNDYLETTDIIESKLDFTGKVLETKTTHKKTGKAPIVTIDKLDYDHADRLLSQKQKIGNQAEELIVKNQYDELGQLVKKDVGSGTLKGYKDVTSGISIDNNIITKTGANGWNNGLATRGSIQGDGYVEFIAETESSPTMIGLSNQNTNASYNTIQYAIYLYWNKDLIIYEKGKWKAQFSDFKKGDTFRVERIGNKIHYKKNGVTFYTSQTTSTGNLIGDISMYHHGAKIKNLHIVDNNKSLQEVNYTYNIRGWLKKINDPFEGLGSDLFSMELHYNDSYSTNLYNGNISMAHWKTASNNGNRRYMYSYDDLNRLTYASYSKWLEHSKFNMNTSYDKNGNIQRLYRRGAIVENPNSKNDSHYGTMDYLNYSYDGNQLTKVTDNGNDNYGFKDGTNTGDDYDYDVNGNMISDANKQITSIAYNHLNLPTEILSNSKMKAVTYIYDATGRKLEKKYSGYGIGTTTTQYADNYIYENNELQFFNTPEGYATPNDNGKFDYIYQYKDHLGNVRLSYTENTDTQDDLVFSNSFENIADWDKSENTFGSALSTIDSNKKKSGNYSGRIDDNYPTNSEKYVNCDIWTAINNTEDTYYTFSAWVFIEDVPENSAQIFLMTRKAGETGYPSGYYHKKSTERGRWVYLEKTALVSSDVKELNFRIDNNKDGTVWFDDVKIVKGNTSKTIIVEESNYYPFGLKHKGYNNIVNSNGNSTAQKFGFGGKELNEELGLEWSDFGARNYDASLGSFMNIDPLADKYRDISPYNYTANNPILYTDPDGREIIISDNTKDALTKLAQIAATKSGRTRLNSLIGSPHHYTMKSIFFTNNNVYDPQGQQGKARTIYYASSSWRFRSGGGAPGSMYLAGHEIDHAYNHEKEWYSATTKDLERSAVKFGNYLRSVHGEKNMRTSYGGAGTFSDNPKSYNSFNEKITKFKENLSIETENGSTILGFSYETSTGSGDSTTEYMLSVSTEDGTYAYRRFTDKKEYDKAVKRVNKLKKKEDEDK